MGRWTSCAIKATRQVPALEANQSQLAQLFGAWMCDLLQAPDFFCAFVVDD